MSSVARTAAPTPAAPSTGRPFTDLPTGVQTDAAPHFARGMFRDAKRVRIGKDFIATQAWLVRTATLLPEDRARFGSVAGFQALGWVKAELVEDVATNEGLVKNVRQYLTPKPKGRKYFRTPIAIDFVHAAHSHLLRLYVSQDGGCLAFNDGLVNSLGDPAVLAEASASGAYVTLTGSLAIAPYHEQKAQEVAALLRQPLFRALMGHPMPLPRNRSADSPSTIAQKVSAARKGPAKRAGKR